MVRALCVVQSAACVIMVPTGNFRQDNQRERDVEALSDFKHNRHVRALFHALRKISKKIPNGIAQNVIKSLGIYVYIDLREGEGYAVKRQGVVYLFVVFVIYAPVVR